MSGQGLRMTRNRVAILEVLRASGAHLTADEIYAEVSRALPRISLATVYRNLDVLAKHGYIRTVAEGGGRRHFDAKVDDHYHIRCVECGRVDDIAVDSAESLPGTLHARTDYEVRGFVLSFVGVCPECQARRRAETHANGGEGDERQRDQDRT